jgi:15-cis-phytoene synthase
VSPELRQSYRLCARIARRYGKTYAAAAMLLPAQARRHVHAVYAFCRLADDIVDERADWPVSSRVAALAAFGDRFRTDLAAGHSTDPAFAAVVATVHETGIDPCCFDRFLHSMAMDFTTVSYPTWKHLCEYMDGSAAVIGEMMLPVLQPTDPAAFQPARQLGIAFQLTNFLRDVGEDLDRGRVYLPAEDLERFSADPWARTVTPEWRDLMRFEIARTRQIYAAADTGLAYLPSRSARCVGTARLLYSRILDLIEAADYDVFTRRARVPTAQKSAVAIAALVWPAGVRAAPTAKA